MVRWVSVLCLICRLLHVCSMYVLVFLPSRSLSKVKTSTMCKSCRRLTYRCMNCLRGSPNLLYGMAQLIISVNSTARSAGRPAGHLRAGAAGGIAARLSRVRRSGEHLSPLPQPRDKRQNARKRHLHRCQSTRHNAAGRYRIFILKQKKRFARHNQDSNWNRNRTT